jgi:hypothetical protein
MINSKLEEIIKNDDLDEFQKWTAANSKYNDSHLTYLVLLHNSVSIFKFLFDIGYTISEYRLLSWNPNSYKSLLILQHLVDNNYNLNNIAGYCKIIETIFFKACCYDNLEIIEYITEKFTISDHYIDESFKMAFAHKRFNITEFLIKKFRIGQNTIDRIFIDSCSYGHLALIELFMNNFTIKDNIINQGLTAALTDFHFDIAKYLLAHCSTTVNSVPEGLKTVFKLGNDDYSEKLKESINDDYSEKLKESINDDYSEKLKESINDDYSEKLKELINDGESLLLVKIN